MRLIGLVMTALSLMFLGTSCGNKWERELRAEQQNFKRYFPALLREFLAAKDLTLYEGLPHPFSERESFASERDRKQTTKLHGFYFYPAQQTVKLDDARSLQALFVQTDAFVPYRGPKACGGFHPDYALEWTAEEGTYQMLICFGCHEVKVFGPNSAVYCDIPSNTYQALKTLLSGYVKQRPPFNPQIPGTSKVLP